MCYDVEHLQTAGNGMWMATRPPDQPIRIRRHQPRRSGERVTDGRTERINEPELTECNERAMDTGELQRLR
jgi:hypothetical protein